VKYIYTILISWLILGSIHSQESTLAPSKLSFSDFLSMVKNYHPVVKQGDLLIQSGLAGMLSANGNFDPKINSSFQQKRFKEDPYYTLWNTSLEVPTKLGLSVNAGYDRTSGINLNPQNLDPEGGLLYAGVKLPIGQGLLYDKRRAQLDQAEIMISMSELQRSILINDLLLDAGLAYWTWWEAYELNQLLEQSVSIAEDRLSGTLQSIEAGDQRGVDSIEARILVQTLTLAQQEALINYLSTTLLLSAYLWDDNETPLIIDRNTSPSNNETSLLSTDNTLVQNKLLEELRQHPLLEQYDNKIQQLAVKKRLAKEGMKPKVDLKYNFLADASGGASQSFNNYTLAVDFSIPLLFRQAKANIQRAEIEIQDTGLAQANKQRELENKLAASIVKWKTYINQFQQASAMANNYNIMLEAEQELFDNGESSLFLINSRQNKLVAAEQKTIELLRKIQESKLEAFYYAGNSTDL